MNRLNEFNKRNRSLDKETIWIKNQKKYKSLGKINGLEKLQDKMLKNDSIAGKNNE